MKNYFFESRVDTLTSIEPLNNRKEIIDLKGVSHITSEKKGTILTKTNPNNCFNEYSTTYAISHTTDALLKIYAELDAIDYSLINLHRIDVCTDCTLTFQDDAKLIDLMHKCIRAHKKNGLAWLNISENEINFSNFYFRLNNTIHIEFYDKAKESRFQSQYPTRLELRFLRPHKTDLYIKSVHKAIRYWTNMPNNLSLVEKQMQEILLKKFKAELSINPNLDFSNFVYKYSHFIYTKDLLKFLYSKTNLMSPFKSWFYRFNKHHSIKFYTKKNLTAISKAITKSLVDYTKK